MGVELPAQPSLGADGKLGRGKAEHNVCGYSLKEYGIMAKRPGSGSERPAFLFLI